MLRSLLTSHLLAPVALAPGAAPLRGPVTDSAGRQSCLWRRLRRGLTRRVDVERGPFFCSESRVDWERLITGCDTVGVPQIGGDEAYADPLVRGVHRTPAPAPRAPPRRHVWVSGAVEQPGHAGVPGVRRAWARDGLLWESCGPDPQSLTRSAPMSRLLLLAALLLAPAGFAQGAGQLRGLVTDSVSGEPMPGVAVRLVGLGTGGATGPDGRYAVLGLPAGRHAVEVAFPGYAIVRDTVEVVAHRVNTLDLALTVDPDATTYTVCCADTTAGPGILSGVVTDDAGKTIAGANVRINGTPLGAATNLHGAYRILGVPVGTYAVTASFAGFRSQTTTGIDVNSGFTTRADLQLGTVSLGEVTVTYDRPLIGNDAIGAPRVVSGEDIVNLPVRGVASVATRQGGIVSDEAGGALSVRGGRSGDVAYYVDGVKVLGGAPPVNQQAIQEQEMLIGTTPPRYGDGQAAAARTHSGLDREGYAPQEETGFQRPADAPLSTFSIDVDRASYANARRFLTGGALPPADAVRVEEFVNAFDYGLAGPGRGAEHPFQVTTETADAPWADGHRLVRIGLQGRRIATDDLPPANLVFLIDVSGSMSDANKLPLLQRAFRLLVRELRPQDRVAIVVYAGATGVVLEPTRGDDQPALLAAIDRLRAGGSTAGAAGIRLAYDLARQHFDAEATNRVILATDGDFNVGTSSDAELKALIERERESGVLFSVLGFGEGNLQDAKMELLASNGNGTYSYIDGVREAERVLVRELGGTLTAIAKDVKLQVEFNPARVAGYRLIGYENRRLRDEEFRDDARDAGDLGAGHTVTALYEIVPVGLPVPNADVDALRYQTPPALTDAAASGELLTVALRYKPALTAGVFAGESVLLSATAADDGGALAGASEAMRWAVAVAEAAQLLRASALAPGASYDHALALARGARGPDLHGDRAEFIRLVETAQSLVWSQPVEGQQAMRD